MKTLAKIATGLLLMIVACNQSNEKSIHAVHLIDNTDSLKSPPDYDAVIKFFNLKHDIWQTITVTVSSLSDIDLTQSKTIRLENENRLIASMQERNAKVIKFKNAIKTALNIDTKSTHSHSILYRRIAQHLNVLSSSTALIKQFVVYSDLMENSDISFYDPATISLLKTNPQKVQDVLEKTASLKSLGGIEVWLIYAPSSYKDNNTYMTVANFYKNLLEAKGATVHVQQTFSQ